jgi:hypothetical protein
MHDHLSEVPEPTDTGLNTLALPRNQEANRENKPAFAILMKNIR